MTRSAFTLPRPPLFATRNIRWLRVHTKTHKYYKQHFFSVPCMSSLKVLDFQFQDKPRPINTNIPMLDTDVSLLLFSFVGFSLGNCTNYKHIVFIEFTGSVVQPRFLNNPCLPDETLKYFFSQMLDVFHFFPTLSRVGVILTHSPRLGRELTLNYVSFLTLPNSFVSS